MTRIQRWLANYLRRQGWIVFWLDEPARFCVVERNGIKIGRPGSHEGCWMALHEQQCGREDKMGGPI